MPVFKADMHIHTLTSPCGSLEMSPRNIIEKALEQQLDIIAITDHNCTKQAPIVQKLGAEKGVVVICGAEVNTAEEVHCLTLFETLNQLTEFQFFIDQYLIPIPNKTEFFGEQIVVDEDEMIVEELPYLLTSALDATLEEVQKKVHQLGGLIIPAHIDRPFNGLFSQLGFIPENFKADAFELSKHADVEKWLASGRLPQNATIVRNSDAHHPHQMAESCTMYELNEPSFFELKLALSKQGGRKVLL